MTNDLKTQKKIAKTIKGLREWYNHFTHLMTQERLADFLEISLEEYKKIESGEKPISVVDLTKLANLFDVPLMYFIDKRKCRGAKPTTWKICGEKNDNK